jgi:SAM-dependent methyltransferase
MSGAFQQTYAELYDRHLVPLLFAPYAPVLADSAKTLAPRNVLELAAGTGIATRELARALPEARITATDLNQPMIDRATSGSGPGNVTWRQAGAMHLPFADGSFDLIVCQFGVMFFADKVASFGEAARVLRPGGAYLFTVWADWQEMPDAPLGMAANVVGEMLQRDPLSLLNPPYHRADTIRADVARAGLRVARIERITRPAIAASARDAAFATIYGSLIRTVIEAMDPARLDLAMDAVERAMRARWGDGRVEGATTALLIAAEKAFSAPPAAAG